MTALSLALLLLSVGVTSEAKQSPPRSKRGLMELAGVIKCSTGRSALSYMMYGCYCGLGGQGWPRDRADWCCHKHDCCYGEAERASCETKTHTYNWQCDDRKADCGMCDGTLTSCEGQGMTWGSEVNCKYSVKDRCQKLLCKCDREVAKCLRKAPFIRKYALWPDFLCGCEYPTCSIY